MEKNEDNDDTSSPGALIRCQMWFGLEQDEQHFRYPDETAEIGVYAETYHNVVSTTHYTLHLLFHYCMIS